MTADGRHTNPSRNGRPANDNERTSDADTDSSGIPVADSNRPRAALAIWTDLPERLPILSAEVDLIQACFSDLIMEIIANDNEPQ